MRRGRWVVYCIAFLLVASHYTLATSSYAASIGMTATVLLSPQWKRALMLNSITKMDTSRTHVLYISHYCLGIEKIPVENQTIQLLVFKNGKVVDNQEKKTNASGFVDFVFISEQYSSYMIMIVNKSDISPFIIKQASFSL